VLKQGDETARKLKVVRFSKGEENEYPSLA
jgi:hypothetical protein